MSRFIRRSVTGFVIKWWLVVSVMILSCAQAEEFPADHILDKANVFREHAEEKVRVCAALENLEIKYGYEVFIATYYSVLSSPLQERADELYQNWLGDKNRGLVIVIQLDPVVEGEVVAMSYHKDANSQYAHGAGIISSQEWQGTLKKMRNGIGKRNVDAGGIERMVGIIEREMALSETALPLAPVEQSHWMVKAGIIIGCLLLLIAVLILTRTLFSKILSPKGKYHFPEVEVSLRLGAPYGGGHVAEANFTPSALKK